MRSSTSRLLAAIALSVFVAGVGAACSDSTDRSDSGASSDSGAGGGTSDVGNARPAQPEAADAGQAEDSTGGSSAQGSGAEGVSLAAAAEGRDVISTADVEIEAEQLNEAVANAREVAERAGGFVFGENTVRGDDDPSTILTLKVPPTQFDDALADLATLGRVTSQQISTDDVTEQLVSLDSRITTAEASVARIRALVDQADSVEQLQALENDLLQRETALETLQGEQRTLERQVELATITATFTAKDHAPEPAAVVSADADDVPGFLAGLEASWNALLIVGSVILTMLGAAAPWVPVVVAIVLVVRYVNRRRPTPRATD